MPYRVRTLFRCLVRVAVLCAAATAAHAQDFDAIRRDVDAQQYGPINSLLVQHRGRLVFEGYFRGRGRDDLQLLNSATKSIGATLIGIAHRRGLLQPETPLRELLPQYAWTSPPYAQNAALTLEHALQMRHGLQWDEFTYNFVDARNSAVQMYASPDWYAFTLGRPRIAAPGAAFTYSTGASTLMGGVLRARSGLSPQEAFRQWLAEPLGIARYDWELWSPRGPGHGQRTFPFDEVPLGVGLWLRPVDLMKIGELYLAGGVHAGTRILDAEWIARSWTAYSNAQTDAYFGPSSESPGYGYQWWFRRLGDASGRAHDCWYADGAGRQYLVICPRDELIVVSTGDSYQYTGPGAFTLLRERILPALPVLPSAGMSGFYASAAMPGQGLAVEVVPERGLAIVAWYTHAQGAQRWYVMQGPLDGDRAAFAEVLRVEGGTFAGPSVPELRTVGNASLRWTDCGTVELAYAVDAGQGRATFERLAGNCAP